MCDTGAFNELLNCNLIAQTKERIVQITITNG